MIKNKKNNQLYWRILDVAIVFLWLVCLNASAIKEFDQFPKLDSFTGRGWQIALSYISVALLVLIILKRDKKLGSIFYSAWLDNRWLLVFLAFSAASLIWSVDRTITLYKVLLLICSTFISSYVAVRFRAVGVMDILTWFAGIATLLSLGIVFLFPEIAIMHGAGHFGSWRGLFWHRNHTGIMMAFFNMIFLMRFLANPVSGKKINPRTGLVFALFYILAAIHVFGSKSATGRIIFVCSNLLLLTVFLWMKWRSKIKPWQYYALFAIFAVTAFLLISNLSVVFQLFNRDPSMTGRTRMWPDLIYNTYLLKPLLGHGFATIWAQESFRILIQQRWGWSYQPYFADNGYIDILLNLGLVGLLIFLYGAAVVVQRVIIKLYKHNLPGFLFLLAILVQVFMANISYSFLFEVDYFMWSMLVLVAFLVIGESACEVDSPRFY